MSRPKRENRWATAEPCDKCGRPKNEHTLKQGITCIYGGQPLKDGGTWDATTTDKVAERIARRLG